MDEGVWDVYKFVIIGILVNVIGLVVVCFCVSIGVIMIVSGEEMVCVCEGVCK